MKGIITKGIGGFYYILAEDDKIYECKARGIFRRDKIIPTVGDHVEISVTGDKGNIERIMERGITLVRPAVANVDLLVIVIASAPEPSLFLIDKLLVNAGANGLQTIICINKSDLSVREDIASIYSFAGYKVITVSAYKNQNIDLLNQCLNGKIAAFAGLSGVGKSSLLNLLCNNEMETGELSEKIERGRHTTRHVELLSTKSGGLVFDTPGFSSFDIDDIDSGELENYFPEFGEFIGKCRFRGCAHINEPDCAIRDALAEGKIAISRYESYKLMYETIKNKKLF